MHYRVLELFVCVYTHTIFNSYDNTNDIYISINRFKEYSVVRSPVVVMPHQNEPSESAPERTDKSRGVVSSLPAHKRERSVQCAT